MSSKEMIEAVLNGEDPSDVLDDFTEAKKKKGKKKKKDKKVTFNSKPSKFIKDLMKDQGLNRQDAEELGAWIGRKSMGHDEFQSAALSSRAAKK